MGNRLTAARHLVGQLGHMTVSMGEMILATTTRPERATYYEDHF